MRRQNDEDLLTVLRAGESAHARARRLASARVAVSVFLAAGAVLAVVVPALQTVLTTAGFLWALVYAVGAGSWTESEFRTAALLQETFDTRLYDIPWNEMLAGNAPSADEISRLARRYQGPEERLRDYYEIRELPRPLDLLSCILQNLAWGARIRRRYAAAVQAGVIGWIVTGVAVGVSTGMTLASLLTTWFIPSLGLLLLGVDIVRAQRETAAAREHARQVILREMREHAHSGLPPERVPDLLVLARQAQDVLLRTRLAQARVPNWFFRRFLDSDRADFAAAMDEVGSWLPRA
ncbi:S-4TM family putative pore-forming effector [Streptomyces sp. IMTB 2501]|uniref:S-4TM family putative pore-forming effector n=1 Tax=Streptomyces sp. IMTB 2501 TaxID=1776340 RepID=UPI00117D420B|nr:S-4TM family putative pore-forming effector [Streptomyces sp. IMTB 2501]